MNRYLVAAIILSLYSQAIFAECMGFAPAVMFPDIEYIVHVEVISANEIDFSTQTAPINHEFSAEVYSSLKGSISKGSLLNVSYPVSLSLPAYDTFQADHEYLLFVSKVESDGGAELYGTMCGFSGWKVESQETLDLALSYL